MADFKNAFANSVSNSSATTVYTAPASKTSILLELDLSNKTGSDVTVDVTITDNSNSDTASTLGNDLPIPAGGTLKVVEGQKIVLMAQDAVKVLASAGSAVDAIASVLEDI